MAHYTHKINYPVKIQVEVTTRCNMACSMCVKYADGSDIQEADLKFESFKKLSSALEHCEVLILNGIGEPLLHPELAEMAAFAKERMPKGSSIGFQTNGLLITDQKAESLVESGVDTFCISIDSLESGDCNVGELHGQTCIDRLARTFSKLSSAGEKYGRKVRLGVEFVLMAETYKQLPQVISWASSHGAEFVVCSHVFAYNKSMQDQSLFNTNTSKAYSLFKKWQNLATEHGVDFYNYFDVVFKFIKSDTDKKLVDIVKDMFADAKSQDIWINFRSLIEWDKRMQSNTFNDINRIYAESVELAERSGIALRMPPLMASDNLSCRFLEEGAVFITSMGDISPCQFLWHGFSCYMDGSEKVVKPTVFGNLDDGDFSDVWNSVKYVQFRDDVLKYEYPYCSNCSLVPCDDIIGRANDFEYDCLGVKVPCGHCPWAMGGLQCLL
ncbi:radical SAM/SPASM family putative metalloenzyme maturase [Maridesulfovibrio zosterae]|uniref:radical SAM/SPASM family putative metalloenzyme maturase n=1 Tax=Maridesulfovibrio zosterae TaxID=82171 RepID=UPI000416041B|nr:radical SAM/SPASM family putative metalloenzyme maturase [Maridesulfovibrio zosterae]